MLTGGTVKSTTERVCFQQITCRWSQRNSASKPAKNYVCIQGIRLEPVFWKYNKIKHNWHKERGHAISHLKAGVLIWRFSICYSHSSVSLTVSRKLCRIHMLKGQQCHGCLFHFVTCIIALCAMKLEVNKEVTCKRRNHSFLYQECTSQALYQTLQKTKTRFEKLLG